MWEWQHNTYKNEYRDTNIKKEVTVLKEQAQND